MPVSRGDIVLVPVPDTSGKPGKTRPALVVSSDHNNKRLEDVIVAIVTTTIRASLEPTQLLVELSTPEGRRSGLLRDSPVKCERLHTLMQNLIHRRVGSLSPAAMLKIDECLKVALQVP